MRYQINCLFFVHPVVYVTCNMLTLFDLEFWQHILRWRDGERATVFQPGGYLIANYACRDTYINAEVGMSGFS